MNETEAIFNRRFIAYLTIGLLIAALGYIGAITFCTVPDKNVRVVDTVLGFLLGTLVSTLLTFWYGSSKSGQSKDAVIQAQLPNPVPPEPAPAPAPEGPK